MISLLNSEKTLLQIVRVCSSYSSHSFRFDEMHYGKYAAMYLKNTFFFDANPPLGKMLVALAGYVAGFDGKILC